MHRTRLRTRTYFNWYTFYGIIPSVNEIPMQKMLFFVFIWSWRTMSWKMKTMPAKFPNRERVSIGISVDVLLLFGARLCSAMLFGCIFQWYAFGICCYIVIFVCVLNISLGLSYSQLLVLFFPYVAAAYHQANSCFWSICIGFDMII